MKNIVNTSDIEDATLILILFISFILFYNFGDNDYDLYDLICKYLINHSK